VAGKWDGKLCPVCHEGTLHDGEHAEDVDYRGATFRSIQRGAYCDRCGDGLVYNDPAVEQKWADFRDRVDGEQAAELSAIRETLGLTQEEASRLSGGGHNAFSRYERREAQPVVGVLNLFRLLARYPFLVDDLMARARTPAPHGALVLTLADSANSTETIPVEVSRAAHCVMTGTRGTSNARYRFSEPLEQERTPRLRSSRRAYAG
jgi:HTH-type transcriptional regulator / antitoxin MqsA